MIRQASSTKLKYSMSCQIVVKRQEFKTTKICSRNSKMPKSELYNIAEVPMEDGMVGVLHKHLLNDTCYGGLVLCCAP